MNKNLIELQKGLKEIGEFEILSKNHIFEEIYYKISEKTINNFDYGFYNGYIMGLLRCNIINIKQMEYLESILKEKYHNNSNK